MDGSRVLWAVCVLRVALATVYFQEEFLDGGEGAAPVVVGVPRCSTVAGFTFGPDSSQRSGLCLSLKVSKP